MLAGVLTKSMAATAGPMNYLERVMQLGRRLIFPEAHALAQRQELKLQSHPDLTKTLRELPDGEGSRPATVDERLCDARVRALQRLRKQVKESDVAGCLPIVRVIRTKCCL